MRKHFTAFPPLELFHSTSQSQREEQLPKHKPTPHERFLPAALQVSGPMLSFCFQQAVLWLWALPPQGQWENLQPHYLVMLSCLWPCPAQHSITAPSQPLPYPTRGTHGMGALQVHNLLGLKSGGYHCGCKSLSLFSV